MRVLDPSSKDVDYTTASAEEALAANPLCMESKGLHTKVMQVELAVGVLVQHLGTGAGSGKFTWVSGRIPTSLYAVESTSAANTLGCLKQILDAVPGINALASDASIPFRIRHSCTDRYAANIAAERGLSAMYAGAELVHTFCDVHRAYSATKAAMKRVEYDVSGMLAFGLGYGEPGSVSLFQQILGRIFSRELTVYHETPPTQNPESKSAKYQQELFQAFLPLEGIDDARARLNRKRRYVLRYLVNGDMTRDDEIQHYCPFGCCVHIDATCKTFAVFCSWALCPRQVPVFPRSRWTQYESTVDYCGLLAGTHGLLGKLLAELAGKPTRCLRECDPADIVPEAAPALQDDADEWDQAFAEATAAPPARPESAQGDQQEDNAAAQVLGAARPVACEEDDGGNAGDNGLPEDAAEEWKKKKRQHKQKARLWADSCPFERLAPGLSFVHNL